jgi:quinol monooxygenase YgiN
MNSENGISLATCSIDMHFASKEMDHAVQLLLSVKGHIQAKLGCRACEVGMEAEDAGLVHYREEWESAEAFHRHVQSEEFRRVLIAVDLCCEEPRIVVGNLSGHIGMAYLQKLREERVKLRIDGDLAPLVTVHAEGTGTFTKGDQGQK